MGPMRWRMVWKNHFSDLPFVEGYPFARAENIDIQSRVLLRPLWTKNPARSGREIAIRPTKKTCRLARFEAPELGYPKI